SAGDEVNGPTDLLAGLTGEWPSSKPHAPGAALAAVGGAGAAHAALPRPAGGSGGESHACTRRQPSGLHGAGFDEDSGNGGIGTDGTGTGPSGGGSLPDGSGSLSDPSASPGPLVDDPSASPVPCGEEGPPGSPSSPSSSGTGTDPSDPSKPDNSGSGSGSQPTGLGSGSGLRSQAASGGTKRKHARAQPPAGDGAGTRGTSPNNGRAARACEAALGAPGVAAAQLVCPPSVDGSDGDCEGNCDDGSGSVGDSGRRLAATARAGTPLQHRVPQTLAQQTPAKQTLTGQTRAAADTMLEWQARTQPMQRRAEADAVSPPPPLRRKLSAKPSAPTAESPQAAQVASALRAAPCGAALAAARAALASSCAMWAASSPSPAAGAMPPPPPPGQGGSGGACLGSSYGGARMPPLRPPPRQPDFVAGAGLEPPGLEQLSGGAAQVPLPQLGGLAGDELRCEHGGGEGDGLASGPLAPLHARPAHAEPACKRARLELSGPLGALLGACDLVGWRAASPPHGHGGRQAGGKHRVSSPCASESSASSARGGGAQSSAKQSYLDTASSCIEAAEQEAADAEVATL
ncbi:hypothetical protein T492DRAFT_886644, partial [Pavlovales sp. CCMP2436]